MRIKSIININSINRWPFCLCCIYFSSDNDHISCYALEIKLSTSN